MEMVCESGGGPYRSPSLPVQCWTSADMSATHQSCLLKQLDQQRRQELFCDCDVVVEGQLFRAHRNVLFGSSGYFRMLLSHGAREETSEPVSASFDAFGPDVFATILDFVYSGRLELHSGNVIEVMSAASYLQMDHVIAYCKAFIKSSLEISAKEDDGGGGGGDGCYEASPALAMPDDRRMLTSCREKEENLLWNDQVQVQVQVQVQGEAISPEENVLPQNSPVTVTVQQPRRRGSRKRSATQRYAQDDASAIDLQRASDTNPGAQKAEELYATLPTIVGVVGNFNKDSGTSMRFKCPFCPHTVKRKADLKRHLRCHTGERPYPCQACNKRFTRLEHLRSHFETIHQARKLVCRKCKRHVTEQSGRVVCEGTRRYRLCGSCIQESALIGDGDAVDEPGLLLGVEEEGEEQQTPEEEHNISWAMMDDNNDEDDLAEDSGTDLIIQEVEDSDEEPGIK